MYRRHTLAPQCVRCCLIFADEAKLIEHQREPEGCVVRIDSAADGLNKKQVERLKHRKSMFQAGSEDEKWKIVYLVCFPDTALDAMPTPCEYTFTSEVLQSIS